MSTSYIADRENRDLAAELARLRAQVDLTWDVESRHFRTLGLDAARDVLELGCGPGYVLKRWSRDFPDAHLTGLDRDPALLAEARGRENGDRIGWIEGDATATGLPAGGWDAVLARYLWQHLRSPSTAAAEMFRLLRPGGTALVVDVDAELWGIAQPTFPEVIPIHIKHARSQQKRGGDRRIGRRLHRLLDDAGFNDVRLDVLAVNSDEMGLDPFLPQLDPDRQLVALRDGTLSEEEIRVLREAHQRFISSPDAFVMMTICVASGRKPGA